MLPSPHGAYQVVGYSVASHEYDRQHLKTHLFRAQKSQRIVYTYIFIRRLARRKHCKQTHKKNRHPSPITLRCLRPRDDPSGCRRPAQIPQLDTPQASKKPHKSIHNQYTQGRDHAANTRGGDKSCRLRRFSSRPRVLGLGRSGCKAAEFLAGWNAVKTRTFSFSEIWTPLLGSQKLGGGDSPVPMVVAPLRM